MKTVILYFALCQFVTLAAYAQDGALEQFRHDQQLQDSIISAIVANHSLMSQLVGKLEQHPMLREMVLEHLSRSSPEMPGATGTHDHPSHETTSHYVGDEHREIKALSPGDTRALMNGEGMGFAMAAELNHYPGPRHVLDLADSLGLSATQRRSVKGSFDRMHAEAIQLGERVVAEERSLDRSFAEHTVTAQSLKQEVSAIEQLKGRLRYAHLSAHLAVREMLTPGQRTTYDRLRGYAAAD